MGNEASLSVFSPRVSEGGEIPLFAASVQAGFPSPAEDFIEAELDLNTLLIPRPAATFFVRVKGSSMEGAGIFEGDILIVDRSLSPSHGKIVIAVIQGELTVKRIHLIGGELSLLPENPRFPPIKIRPDEDFHIWGVVSYVIHKP